MANVNLRSLNFPDHFIRHSNFRAMLTRRGGPILDFSFTIVPRGVQQVALRSTNFPDRVLRHRNFEIHLDPEIRDDQFRKDSTFRRVPGLADVSGVSFESVNFPGRYLRHRQFLLWLEAPASSGDVTFRRDATFFARPAAVPIDPGTALNPAED